MAEKYAGYPMLSERNWWRLREAFRIEMPEVVTPAYLKALLALSSEYSANSNVLVPLKRMGLIDSQGVPTALARDWCGDERYADVCARILRAVYPPELLERFPDARPDRMAVRDWFLASGTGQGGVDKVSAFFLLLKSGEIRESKLQPPKKPSARPSLHIDLQVHISPDSTPEQIEATFASIRQLYGMK